MEGWIKLHRKLTEWEWYTDSKMLHLFLHLLISANHKPSKFQGIEVNKGQLITGRHKLSASTGLSEQNIRTCLAKLESTNEITIKTTNKFSIITLVNYDLYQNESENLDKVTSGITNKLTNNQPTINQQLTTNKNEKNKENEKNNEESHNEIFRSLWKNQIWVEQLSIKWKKEPREILDHLNSFRLECITKDEFKVNEKDAKSHFVNWVKFNPLPEPEKPKGYVYNPPSLKSFETNDW